MRWFQPRRCFSAAAAAAPGPAPYPRPLFWTRVDSPPNAHALSFARLSPTLHASAARSSRPDGSPAVIGWVSGHANVLPTPANFFANPRFEEALHGTIKANVHLDEGWRAMAASQKQGYMTITDARVFTPWGRVADPEDILGAVLLEDGNIVPFSYERFPSHRLVTLNGLTQLTESLQDKLVQFE
ncbi:hypothetical protein HDU84_006699 [Entophlyctis sp. JEL0112]|nr:hypothetical protein HDU84_006699 [Entophlyctis sp. JEL0112]